MAQITIERRIGDREGKVDFSEVTKALNEILEENPDCMLTDSIVIPILDYQLFGGSIIHTKTVGYDCCFILSVM